MPRYVAFLRGINLGKRRPPMSRLREIFEEMGFEDVATFIASGNVIFNARKQDQTKLENRIAKQLEATLGYPVDTFVRTLERVAEISQTKPFPEDGKDGYAIHVGFFHSELPKATAKKLEAIRGSDDAFRVTDKEYFWLRHGGVLESDVWDRPEMKELRLPASSMRNMKSLRKLIAKFAPDK